VENFTLAPSGVTADSYVFSGNGCFDPNVTSTGLQPANYDDWSLIYTRYRVWGSKIRYTIAQNGTSSVNVQVVVGPRHLSTALTTLNSQQGFQAQPYTRFHSTFYTPPSKGTLSMSTQKFIGMSKAEFEGNDDLTSLTTSNPTHQWYWQFTSAVSAQSGTGNLLLNVVIEYDVEFWDRVDTTLDLVTRAQAIVALQALRSPVIMIPDADEKKADKRRNVR
jgi:hypothetical protein